MFVIVAFVAGSSYLGGGFFMRCGTHTKVKQGNQANAHGYGNVMGGTQGEEVLFEKRWQRYAAIAAYFCGVCERNMNRDIMATMEATQPTAYTGLKAQKQQKKRKAVAIWLVAGVIMLMIQILLGGATRLTGSGLSITEWKPIHGAVPPLNQAQWQEEFENYKVKASGQYQYENSDFTLSDFKGIYWWEWSHREWARLVGVVFLIGFIYFLARGYLSKDMVAPLVILFILGALQGAIGWIMVQSGLNPDDVRVSHIKLALHFLAALVLLAYTYIFALKLLAAEGQKQSFPALNRLSWILLVLLSVQLCFGAFMAGLRAGPAAPTWPTVNGEWIPGNLSQYGNQQYSGIDRHISNPIGVQYIHRTLAYLIFGFAIARFIVNQKVAGRPEFRLLRRAGRATFLLTCLQVLLGIFTVLSAKNIIPQHFGQYEWLALAHQAVAMCLLLAIVTDLYLLNAKRGVVAV